MRDAGPPAVKAAFELSAGSRPSRGEQGTGGLSGRKNHTFIAAEILSTLSVKQFMMVAQNHNDSIRDGAHFTVVRNGMGAYRLYIEDPQYGSLGYDHVDFEEAVDRRYLMVLLFEYAATLGLVGVRYVDSNLALDDYDDFWGTEQLTRLSRYDGLRAVRLTELGKRAAIWLLPLRLFQVGRIVSGNSDHRKNL